MCETGRLFTCNRCHRQVVICASCDRGHQYCSRACSDQSRAENRREARRRYRHTERGRETGRDRQRHYRIRQADRARAAARAAPEMADIAPVDVVSSAVDDSGDEETVTDHTSGLPRRRLRAVFPAHSRRESPLRCIGCGRICTHVVLHDP